MRGESLISGLRNKDLRQLLGRTTARIAHARKRLRLHGLLEKTGHVYMCCCTDRGRRVIVASLKLRTLVLIPALADHRAAARQLFAEPLNTSSLRDYA